MKYISIAVLFVFMLILSNCTKENNTINESGLKYFPIEEGFYRIYDVDSITINADLGINDSAHYQIKEIQDSLFLDGGSNLSMRIKRYKRQSDSLSWEIADIWTAHRNSSSAQVVEENVRKFLLALPPREDVNWDINAFNNEDEWNCSYNAFHEPIELTNFDFDSTVTVQFDDNINLIERETGHLIFAAHVGLVEKKEQILNLNEIIPVEEMPTWNQIENGVILSYTIKEYGYE